MRKIAHAVRDVRRGAEKDSRCIQRDSGEEPRAVLAHGHIRI